MLALARGEEVSAIWLVVAALGSYAIAYRFYARFIARKVLQVDDTRATPAERLDNGVDFQPTDRRVLFGHHFAAIAGRRTAGRAGAGRADGLPARHHLDHRRRHLRRRRAGHGRRCSSRCAATARASARWPATRSARSAAWPRLVAVFAIMIILLAVLALVVVNALAESPWGTFSIAMTIPIALFMGFYLRYTAAGPGHRDQP